MHKNYSKINYVCSYLANTANLTSNFQRKISLQIVGFYFNWGNTDNYYARCYKVNDAKTCKIPELVVSFYAYKDIKLYVLDPFHLKRTNKLSKLNQSTYQSRSLRMLIKRTSADVDSVIIQNLKIYLHNYQKKQLFSWLQRIEKQLWQLFKLS